MLKYAILVVFLVFVLHQDYAESVCCNAPCGSPDLCNDCTPTTPYCGRRGCNIFGCNCAGGCRLGKGCHQCRRRRSVGDEEHVVSNATLAIQANQGQHDSEEHLKSIFAEFDKNKNGVLEFSEAQEWGFKRHAISKRDVHKMMTEFVKIDANSDGIISRHEIDQE